MGATRDQEESVGRLRQRPGVGAHSEDASGASSVGAEAKVRDSVTGKTNEGQVDDVERRTHKSKKTYGRTPDGTVFTVPTTHDMVSQLLDPREPKNLSDVVVLSILGFHILAAYFLPTDLKRPMFAAVFLFWRAAYNIGIGYLLRVQSHHRLLVTKAKKWHLFVPSEKVNPRPWLYRFLKRELKAKIPDEDYTFETAPIEYNTWLVFRRVVDLILMCDFASYCLFAIICGFQQQPGDEAPWMSVGRWGLGLTLVGFNLWVKLDAHRVVKDYAWYWGDFFYLIDQELTFDGVFEMAPHPMYSIGYIGYYGISMMAHSYDVLGISIVAHLAQFVFLIVVENPHIDKTYNPPPPRMRGTVDRAGAGASTNTSDAELYASVAQALSAQDGDAAAVDQIQGQSQDFTPQRHSPATVHNLMGLRNIDLFRISDYSVILLCTYLGVLALVTPKTQVWQALFVAHAVGWRLWYSLGLGWILTKQSKEKMFTRHFVKYGDSHGEAWRQWKSMYHLSTAMVHASFITACWKMYAPPAHWAVVGGNGGEDDWAALKHVVGIGLVALQTWTSISIYDELGEFGWFYGDFFFDSPRNKLTYGSIYRFLNNPERVMGAAGLWGAALITWSRAIFVLALTSQLLTLGFISYVEKPHMQKVYGRAALREEAGLTKFVKRQLPPPVKEWSESVDRVLDDAKTFVEEFVEAARPKLAAGVSTMVRDTTALFNKYPTRLTISRLNPALAGLDPKYYSVSVDGTRALNGVSERSTGKESVQGRKPKDVKTLVFEYGAPIRVRWTAPKNHSRRDWIGLYMVTDNRSRELTEVPSLGRWVPTCSGEYDRVKDDAGIITSDLPLPRSSKDGDNVEDPEEELVQGEMAFSGDKLWWTQGVFEFRYHHDGNHNVMSISPPFEVRISRFDDGDGDGDDEGEGGAGAGTGVVGPASDGSGAVTYERAVEAALLPLVQNCLDRDPEIAPSTVDEPFGPLVERDSKYAKRVVYAIRHTFGIEFAPAVVPADGNVRKLAWRICNAKQTLAPYSMSRSRGATTPVLERYPQFPQTP